MSSGWYHPCDEVGKAETDEADAASKSNEAMEDEESMVKEIGVVGIIRVG